MDRPGAVPYNEKPELFFLSMLDTKHVRNILSDPRVSVAIYSHPGPPGGNLGLQISGVAQHLTEESSADGWQSFKIIPREIWCFDSRVFGTERRQVDISDLRIRRTLTRRPAHEKEWRWKWKSR